MSDGHLVWSFILRPLNCHSNLNLPSNHISSINDLPNLSKTFKLSFNRIMKYYVPIYAILSILMICFFLLPPVAKQLEILSYQLRSVA